MNNLAEFSSDILRNYGSLTTEKKNLILSPLSLYEALMMLYEGAEKETKEELKAVLIGDKEEPVERKGFLGMARQKADGDISALLDHNTLNIANALVKRMGSDAKKEYVKLLKKKYDAEIFENIAPDKIAHVVNDWVSLKTNKMIENLVDDSVASSPFVLLNAVCFEDKWERAYKPDEINDGPFWDMNGDKQDVVYLESEEHHYIEDEQLTGFIKPYKGGKFSFMGLLPNAGKDPMEILQNMEEGYFTKLFQNAQVRPVNVSIPEFKADFEDSFKDTLIQMGVTKCFLEGAEFGAITDDKIMVADVFHKAHIEVDRNGTKAAAATAIVMMCTAVFEDNPRVDLTSPFLYAIMHNETGLPIFIGCVYRVEE